MIAVLMVRKLSGCRHMALVLAVAVFGLSARSIRIHLLHDLVCDERRFPAGRSRSVTSSLFFVLTASSSLETRHTIPMLAVTSWLLL